MCHHPPVTAHHADGRKWSLHQDFTMTSRFRGKYLSIIPIGYTYIKVISIFYITSYKFSCYKIFLLLFSFSSFFLLFILIHKFFYYLFILNLQFNGRSNNYSYKKVTTTVHNIIVGKLWIDNHGEMVITNHLTGDKCFLKFHAYSYFSRDIPRKVLFCN